MTFQAFPFRVLLLVSITVIGLGHVSADTWPSWRGPSRNSVAPAGSYPTTWGETKNVEWKVELPGSWGTSTPAVHAGKIFLTYSTETNNGITCLNLDGKTVWNKELGPSSANRNQKASGANPSPVTDGKFVFAYFKSGEVACLDLDGKIVWQNNTQKAYGEDKLWWDLGTSPVLTADAVVVAVMHQGPSYLVAYDKKSGKVAWKIDRDMDAPGEARDSYTTPLVLPEGQSESIVVLGADHVTSHDAQTGKELWRVGTLNPRGRGNYRSIASPLEMDGMVFAPYCRGQTLTAVKLGGSGDVTESHVAWEIDSTASDVPSPVGLNGKLYMCSDRGNLTCLDAKTGKEIWAEQLPKSRHSYSASPIIAGDHIYCTREDGTTAVVKFGDSAEVVASNVLNEFTYATPVFVDSKIYIRTSKYLVCIASDE